MKENRKLDEVSNSVEEALSHHLSTSSSLRLIARKDAGFSWGFRALWTLSLFFQIWPYMNGIRLSATRLPLRLVVVPLNRLVLLATYIQWSGPFLICWGPIISSFPISVDWLWWYCGILQIFSFDPPHLLFQYVNNLTVILALQNTSWNNLDKRSGHMLLLCYSFRNALYCTSVKLFDAIA